MPLRHIQLSGTGAIDEAIDNPESYNILELRLALSSVIDVAGLQILRGPPSGFSKSIALWAPVIDQTTGQALTNSLIGRFSKNPISVIPDTEVTVVCAEIVGDWEMEIVVDSQ